jgi:hypothetical protein
LDRETTTEPLLGSPAHRSEPASRRPPLPSDPALTTFPFEGRDMPNGGAARAWRLLEVFAWSTRTIGSRSTQCKACLEFCECEGRAIAPVNEGQLVVYVGWLAMEREAGRRSVSAASIPQYLSAVGVVAKSVFDSQGGLTSGPMPILQALLRAYSQWEALSFPRLPHRGGVPADVIQAIWANAMQSAERVVIRDAAEVVLAYVLGLRESSVMSLSAENITHTATKMTVRLVLVKGKPIRHAEPAAYTRTGIADLPSPIDLLQIWTALRPEHTLLFGLPGEGSEWQPGSLSDALQRSLHAVPRCPPHGTTWTSHSLRIGAHTEQTLLGLPVEVRKARFGWGPDSDGMTSLYFDQQIILSPASCWMFGPAMSGHTTPVPSR